MVKISEKILYFIVKHMHKKFICPKCRNTMLFDITTKAWKCKNDACNYMLTEKEFKKDFLEIYFEVYR